MPSKLVEDEPTLLTILNESWFCPMTKMQQTFRVLTTILTNLTIPVFSKQ